MAQVAGASVVAVPALKVPNGKRCNLSKQTKSKTNLNIAWPKLQKHHLLFKMYFSVAMALAGMATLITSSRRYQI